MGKTLTLDEILEQIYERLATEDTGIAFEYFLEDTDYKQMLLQWVADTLISPTCGCYDGMSYNGGKASEDDVLEKTPCEDCYEQRQILKDHGWKEQK